MYETVYSEFSGPVFVQRDAIFTSLVVDKLNYTKEGRCYYVYYCGTGEYEKNMYYMWKMLR